MRKKTRTTRFSIKGKLIVIGIIVLLSFVLNEGMTSISESSIEDANDTMLLRQSQINLLRSLETHLAELSLAAMDAIVDRDTGSISGEVAGTMQDSSRFIRENLQAVSRMADTEEEKRYAQQTVELYPRLEELILVDLKQLIVSKSSEETSFSRIDDQIDEIASRMSDTLSAFASAVAKENAEAIERLHDQMDKATAARRLAGSVVMLILAAILLMIGRSILAPILHAKNMINDISEGEGDLTKRLDVGNDEIGEMSACFNTFTEKLHAIIFQILSSTSEVKKAAGTLSEVALNLSEGSIDTRSRANTVAIAAEEMSSNMNAVAAAGEQASVNVSMVAAAAEELNATVSEIAQNTARARTVAEQTVMKTNATSDRINSLEEAAKDISKVTEAINEISEQTNLLALNATIEAARAGDAGKGFAVVANEIKELARQTATATLEIKQRIEAIQSSTQLTVTDIQDVRQSISDVSEIVSSIAAAVEEQSASTGEISGNVAQASAGIAEVTENVSQSSAVSGNISSEINGVSLAAKKLEENSLSVKQQSIDLRTQAETLSAIVNRFKL